MSGQGPFALLVECGLDAVNVLQAVLSPTRIHVTITGLRENRDRSSSMFVDIEAILGWYVLGIGNLEGHFAGSSPDLPNRIDLSLRSAGLRSVSVARLPRAKFLLAWTILIAIPLAVALLLWQLFPESVLPVCLILLVLLVVPYLPRFVPGRSIPLLSASEEDRLRGLGIALRDGSPQVRVHSRAGGPSLLLAADLEGPPPPRNALDPARTLLSTDTNVAAALDDSLLPLLLGIAKSLGLPTHRTWSGGWARWNDPVVAFTGAGVTVSAAGEGELDGGGFTAHARGSADGTAGLAVQVHSDPILAVSADGTVDVEAELSGALVWIGTLLTGPLLPLGSLAAAWWLAMKFLPFRCAGALPRGLGDYRVAAGLISPLQGIPPYDARTSFQVSGTARADVKQLVALATPLPLAVRQLLARLEFTRDSLVTGDHVLTARARL